ncbi:transcriptional regulator [Amycolatopsis sp. NPDC051102]|uniref:transcriptional regulator n=1 Tax=Amycolatopsis sp. NPDC051102 TaxID=3155163 RepID=UPI00342B83A8
MRSSTVRGLALFAALQATFADVHPLCDQWLQSSEDAAGKGKPGREGAKNCARHVASYTVGQVGAAVAVTRVLGFRVPLRALAAGTAVNAVTHYVIDRRAPLKALARLAGKQGYVEHATVQRRDGVIDETGPGTALTELDQAVHRAIGVAASLLTTWVALRYGRQS